MIKSILIIRMMIAIRTHKVCTYTIHQDRDKAKETYKKVKLLIEEGDLVANRETFVTRPGAGRARHLGARADLPRTEHAMARLKTAMTWDERVYGREYDLAVFNIVAVADFNFGAMEKRASTSSTRATSWPTPRPRPTGFRRDRRRWSRTNISTTGRRPGHLPRLVPALAEGGLHRLSRPELLGRHGIARGQADRGRTGAAGRAIPRGCRAARPPGAARMPIWRSPISTRRPSTTRAPS